MLFTEALATQNVHVWFKVTHLLQDFCEFQYEVQVHLALRWLHLQPVGMCLFEKLRQTSLIKLMPLRCAAARIQFLMKVPPARVCIIFSPAFQLSSLRLGKC